MEGRRRLCRMPRKKLANSTQLFPAPVDNKLNFRASVGVDSQTKDISIWMPPLKSAVVRAPLRVYLMRIGGNHPRPDVRGSPRPGS